MLLTIASVIPTHYTFSSEAGCANNNAATADDGIVRLAFFLSRFGRASHVCVYFPFSGHKKQKKACKEKKDPFSRLTEAIP